MRPLVTLALSFVFLFVSQWGTYGQDIKFTETIKIKRDDNLRRAPKSFCVLEKDLFLIPDEQKGALNFFQKENGSLKSNPSSCKEAAFVRPRLCHYFKNRGESNSDSEGNLAVIDYLSQGGSLLIFTRSGKTDFTPLNIIPCERFGYDMEFTGDGKRLIISGNIIDKENKSWALYSVNIEDGGITYLLPSYQKYGQKSIDTYINEFKLKQTIPAIGVKAYIDLNGDDLFMVWEGALRILHFNLEAKTILRVFGQEKSYYRKPKGDDLANTYSRGEFQATWKEQEKYSYITNIFAASGHVFLIYETAKNASTFRMQTYTPEGKFLTDVAIPGKPDRQMWLDKDSLELYAFSKHSNSDKSQFSILKYKIIVK